MSTTPSAFVTCWSHPLDCLSTIFGPGYDSSGNYTTRFGAVDVNAQGKQVQGDSIGQAAVRAEGIDPGSLTLISPGYAAGLTSQGVDTSNPSSIKEFANQVSSEASTLFQQGYDKSLSQIPLFPGLDFSTPGGAFAGGLVILFFVFIFLWLVSR